MRRAGRGLGIGEGPTHHRIQGSVEDEPRDVLSSEVHDVLGRALKFEHLMVSSGFKPTGFELVSNLELLVVLAFIMQVVFELDDEFDGLAEAVHDEFLGTEGFDLGDLEAFFLLSEFGEDVLLLALEFHLFNTRFLLLFRSEDFGKEAFLAVRLRSCGDDFNDTLGDFFLEAVILDQHGFVDFLQIANFQTRISELVGRGIVNTSAEQCKIGVLLCHTNPPDKLRRADTPKKSLSPNRSFMRPVLKVHASSSQDAKSTPKSAHSSNSKVSGRR